MVKFHSLVQRQPIDLVWDQRQDLKKQSLLTQSESIRQRSSLLQRRHAGSAPPQSMSVSVPSSTVLPQEIQMLLKQLSLMQSDAC
jgi:hypothetical protein